MPKFLRPAGSAQIFSCIKFASLGRQEMVGASNCCDKQLPMSVDDRESCNPSAGRPGSVSE